MTDRVLDLVGPLAGTLVGGLITYVATRAADIRRWKRDKQDRRAQAARDAITKALTWLEPMDNALTTANLQVTALLQFDLEYAEFVTRFPDLVSALAKLDVPRGPHLLLPAGAYEEGHRILRAFDDVRDEAVRWGQRARKEQMPMLGLSECGKELDAIGERIKALRETLTKAYLATYD